MTLHHYPINKPIPLPKRGSWPAARHVFDEASVHALMAAEAAERPLLVRGEPGTGKSQLARAAAEATQRLFLSAVVNARTECQDLQWQFDAVARLGEAQALAHCNADEIPRRINPLRFLSPGPLWWVFDWASAQEQYKLCDHRLELAPTPPNDWQPSQGSVLLIDEIDKADTDLPNGLLETLGNGDFAVSYLGASVRQSQDNPPPLVIVTTNEERELPAAFLRRCLVLPLSLPEADDALLDFLCQRGAVHFEKSTEAVRRKAGELLLEDRKAANAQGLPAPGQAEYLDLLRAVCKLASDERGQIDLLGKINQFVLKKAPALPR
ncbi:MAG: AAA family ATPase [Candidatus Contendobacter sp.]|nr:AAA family ATPase [Candidatus Contendobacter sp.]